MRMILADDIANDARGFLVGAIPTVSEIVHRVQDAAMHRFQPIADIGKGTPDDDAHCVVHVGLTHLVLDVDGYSVVLGGVHASLRGPTLAGSAVLRRV